MNFETSLQQWNEHSYLLTDQLSLPVINKLRLLSTAMRERLEGLAKELRQNKEMLSEELKQVILVVRQGHYLTLHAFAVLLCRKPVSLRDDYLSPMVLARTLSLAFLTTSTHERRAYCSTDTVPRASDAES